MIPPHVPARWHRRLAAVALAAGLSAGAAPAMTRRIIPPAAPESLSITVEPDLGAMGRGEEQFIGPSGLAAASRDGIWVADTGNDRVQLLSHRGSYVQEFGRFSIDPSGTLPEAESLRFDEPTDLVESINREVFIADRNNHRIVRCDRDGRILSTFGPEDGLREPSGIAANSLGEILVADTGNDRIVIFDREGRKLRDLGNYGWGKRQLRFPADVTVTATDGILISDTMNGRVQHFDHFGKLLAVLRGPLVRPRGLKVDRRGLLWVADGGARNVFCMTLSGRTILDLRRDLPGTVLKGPTDVLITSKDELLVADPPANRILRFGLTFPAPAPGGKLPGSPGR